MFSEFLLMGTSSIPTIAYLLHVSKLDDLLLPKYKKDLNFIRKQSTLHYVVIKFFEYGPFQFQVFYLKG